MDYKAFQLVLFLFFFCAVRAFSEGGPPLITDDPDSVPLHHFEINMGMTLDASPTSQLWETPHIDLNYGALKNVQLKWESGVALANDNANHFHSGWESSLIGIKWKFIDGGEEGLSVGTYPQFSFPFLSSNDPLLVDPGVSLILPLEFKKSWGKFDLDGEVGELLYSAGTNGWMYGVCAGYQLSEKLELLGELHQYVQASLAVRGLIAQAGLRWSLTEAFVIIGSLGSTVWIADADTNVTLAFLGVNINL